MARKTVLYVEDEEFDVLFMRRAFDQVDLGADLRVVTDGQQAINYLAGLPPFDNRTEHPFPSGVILDLNLPLVSGFEVLQWARERPELASLSICVFSSSPRQEDEVKARKLGAAVYVQKPRSGLDFPQVLAELRGRLIGGEPETATAGV